MEEPILTRFDPQDQPIVSLTLSSPGLTGAELTRMADPDITRRFRGIPGVASVDLAGGIERELVVEIRPRDLQAAGVSVAQLVLEPAVAEPRLARRAARRRHAGADDPAEGTARRARRISRISSSRSRPAASSVSATSPTSAMPPRSRDRLRSTTTRKPSASTSSSPRGFSTTAVAADIRAAVVEVQTDAAGRRDAAGRARLRRSCRQLGAAASRRRCSKARRSRCSSSSCFSIPGVQPSSPVSRCPSPSSRRSSSSGCSASR